LKDLILVWLEDLTSRICVTGTFTLNTPASSYPKAYMFW